MDYDDISETVKSCLWMGFIPFNIPLPVLTMPPGAGGQKDMIHLGFLDDTFEVIIVKATETVIKVGIYRNRRNPEEKPDDGYALRFHISLTGFNEEPQIAIMKHDEEKAQPTAIFMLTEDIIEKANTTHSFFDAFVVCEMLEFKSMDKNNENKIIIDSYMDCIKSTLTDELIEGLSFILKSPGLEDTFTGRLPIDLLSGVMVIVAMIRKNIPEVAYYLKARYNNTELIDYDVSSLLKYIGLVGGGRYLLIEDVAEQYLVAHRLGMDCHITIIKDFLVSVLDEEYNAWAALEAAVLVGDEDLLGKAAFYFLKHFHRITHSFIFDYYSRFKQNITRMIIHSIRLWVSENDVYVSGFGMVTEL